MNTRLLIKQLIFNCKRRIGLFIRNKRKHYKIIIEPVKFNQFKTQNDCIAAIQLSKVVNSIHSCMRSYLRAARKNKFRNEKDKVELTFLHCALLYEGIKTFCSISKDIKKLDWYTNNFTRIKYYQHQRGDKMKFQVNQETFRSTGKQLCTTLWVGFT